MVGLKKAEAGSEMAVAKKKKAKKQTQSIAAVKDEELEEEWSGITNDTL
jgi:ATP-dependent RNA helicase DDX24/MAK5